LGVPPNKQIVILFGFAYWGSGHEVYPDEWREARLPQRKLAQKCTALLSQFFKAIKRGIALKEPSPSCPSRRIRFAKKTSTVRFDNTFYPYANIPLSG